MAIQLDPASEQNILNMLMEQSVISIEQLNKIKNMSKEIGKTRLETAFELNLANEEKIISILSKSYSIDTVDLKKYKVNDKLKKIVPLDYIRNNVIVQFDSLSTTLSQNKHFLRIRLRPYNGLEAGRRRFWTPIINCNGRRKF